MKRTSKTKRRWTQEELEYLKKYAHRYTMKRLTMHFNRTEISIWRKCKRLGLTRAPYQDGYTLKDLTIAFHCDSRRIQKWAEWGWLRGTRQGPNAKNWNFKDKDITRFLRAHPDELSEEVMQSLWVQDILFEKFAFGMGPLCDMREIV